MDKTRLMELAGMQLKEDEQGGNSSYEELLINLTTAVLRNDTEKMRAIAKEAGELLDKNGVKPK
jgi:nicotinic acid phosphoribosyltransferase